MLFCFERTALLPALFSLLTLAGSAAASDEPDASDALRLSGFGTLGYSVDDNDQAASIRDITQRAWRRAMGAARPDRRWPGRCH